MDRNALLPHIRTLEPDTPLHRRLEQDLEIGVGFGRAWYGSQKEHWIRWLEEYSGPGEYGRKPNSTADAEVIYNRLNCPPMVFWLAEAVGVPEASLTAAYAAALGAHPAPASQCAAIRDVIPWATVALNIEERSFVREGCNPLQHCR